MPRISRLFTVSLLLLLTAAPAPCAENEPIVERIRQSLATSEILPQDYREHVNIQVSADTVAISVYRDPDALPNDCKIDAILITDKVLEADSAVKRVDVAFYDLAQEDKFWQAEVPASSVTEYARGAITRDDVVRSVKLSEHQSNSLAKSYAGLSYKQMVEGLGVVEGPLREARAVTLVRLDKLQSSGSNVSDLRGKFLHMEDLARRGEETQVRRALRELSVAMQKMGGTSQRLSQLDELRQEPDSHGEQPDSRGMNN